MASWDALFDQAEPSDTDLETIRETLDRHRETEDTDG